MTRRSHGPQRGMFSFPFVLAVTNVASLLAESTGILVKRRKEFSGVLIHFAIFSQFPNFIQGCISL